MIKYVVVRTKACNGVDIDGTPKINDDINFAFRLFEEEYLSSDKSKGSQQCKCEFIIEEVENGSRCNVCNKKNEKCVCKDSIFCNHCYKIIRDCTCVRCDECEEVSCCCNCDDSEECIECGEEPCVCCPNCCTDPCSCEAEEEEEEEEEEKEEVECNCASCIQE